VLQEAGVGNDGMVALLDPVRASRGPLILAPNTNIAASGMIKAMLAEPPGHWLVLGDWSGGTQHPNQLA
jgi:hypothetical protein